MQIQIQIVDKNGLGYVDDKGDLYTSRIIEQLISSVDTFEYIGTADDLDLYGLNEEQLPYFIEKLQNKIQQQAQVSKWKNQVTESLVQMEQLHTYLTDIKEDLYFYWKTDLILAKLQEDELLDL